MQGTLAGIGAAALLAAAFGCDGRSLRTIRAAVDESEAQAQGSELEALTAEAERSAQEREAQAAADADEQAAELRWSNARANRRTARWRASMRSRVQSLIDQGWPDPARYGQTARAVATREEGKARLADWTRAFLAAVKDDRRWGRRGAAAYFPAEVMIRDHVGNPMWFEIDVEVTEDESPVGEQPDVVVRVEPLDPVGSDADEDE